MTASDPALANVTSVKILSRYVLELTFEGDDRARVIDVEPMLWGPVFEPMVADYALFRQVEVDEEAGTITWPNGADLAPDELYRSSKPAVPA